MFRETGIVFIAGFYRWMLRLLRRILAIIYKALDRFTDRFSVDTEVSYLVRSECTGASVESLMDAKVRHTLH